MPTEQKLIRKQIVSFCRSQIAPIVDPSLYAGISTYLLSLVNSKTPPSKLLGRFDWQSIATSCGAEVPFSKNLKRTLQVGLVEIDRWFGRHPAQTPIRAGASPARPLFQSTFDPPGFGEALEFHMRRNGENAADLHRGICVANDHFHCATLRTWIRGTKMPRGAQSLEMVRRIEVRYNLPKDHLKMKLPHQGRAARGHHPGLSVGPAELRRLAWHLYDDFNLRSATEQQENVTWARTNVISKTTDYRRYQAGTIKEAFGLKFPGFWKEKRETSRRRCAPQILTAEMKELVRFKTATLTEVGRLRNKKWGEFSANQKIEHFGLFLGALSASSTSAVAGAGVPVSSLTLALLVFPPIWDWYLSWRERRRGFFTVWEANMLSAILELARADTGWLWQRPELANRLHPIPGLVELEDIARAASDWHGQCAAVSKYASVRFAEIKDVARVHRDPFEPILPILEADNPLAEYRKITEEILRRVPDERRYPIQAAEAARSYLMLRIGLHLGVRQRNLRELLICPKDGTPTTERRLAERRCGELRWSFREEKWEVFIPAVAFKNSGSSFFGKNPFRLLIDDLSGLYEVLEAYIDRQRARLLGPASDPGTLFVKTTKRTSSTAAYDEATFYSAWNLTIQRYGIYNPYTGRGAIKGLLAHGPHCVRDVLATHVLKMTGSYEQASYAIQDTPETVMKHYGRFFPQDKAAMAAKVLNRAWEA